MIKLRSNNYRTSQRIIIARLDDWRVHQVALSLDTPHSIKHLVISLDMVELTLQMCRYVSQEFSIENMGFPQHFLTIPESRMICHSPRAENHESLDFLGMVMSSYVIILFQWVFNDCIFLGVATSTARQVALDTGHHSSPGSSGAPTTTTLHFDKVFREDQQDGTSHWNQQVTGFFWA